MFDNICKDMNLNWKEHLIGQAYDGAASMRGAYKGLQAIVKKENPRATYVWYWAHRFNLIIVDAVSICVVARELSGNLEMLYDFIGSSKKRVGFYSEYQKQRYPGKHLRRLKRVGTTRWSSHSSALDTVLDTYDSIIDTLNFIQNDLTTDRVCSVKASSLINYMLSERFVLIALTFKNIFNMTHPFTKFLQGKYIDLLDAINYTQSIFIQIQILCSDESFKNVIYDKGNFINSKLNDFSFTSLEISRVKKIKRMPGEIAAD